METAALEAIGLTHNEAHIYIILSKAGSITAGQLTKRTDIHRSRVYEALERLTRKGLVRFVTINNTKHYSAREPEQLLEITKEHEESIKALIPSIKNYQEEPEITQRVNGYQGKEGIRTLLAETLKEEEIFVFGAPKSSLDIMGETYWRNYNQKVKERNIKTKMIFNDSLRDWTPEIMKIDPRNEVKYLKKQFDSITETFIINDKVVIITWSHQPLGVLLHDKDIARSYKSFFDVLWEEARP